MGRLGADAYPNVISGLVDSSPRRAGGDPPPATASTSVNKAFDTQEDLEDRREHCAPAARVLVSLGGGPGQQVRIDNGDQVALYTVSELLHETTDSVVRMGPGGRQRLTSDGKLEGVLDTKVVDADLSG